MGEQAAETKKTETSLPEGKIVRSGCRCEI